jgi:hypothetical protein
VKGSRKLGTNPRALGTNPRALGTNPRAIPKGWDYVEGTTDEHLDVEPFDDWELDVEWEPDEDLWGWNPNLEHKMPE